MTKPTIVFFGFDFTPHPTPKVFLRTLLYSTANRGHVIEGMYARVRRNGSIKVFSFWGYAEAEKISPGSGLHVGRTGFAANHHFVMPAHEKGYDFEHGLYEIDIIADVVGKQKPEKLTTITINLSEPLSLALSSNDGVLFERRIDGEYEGHTKAH